MQDSLWTKNFTMHLLAILFVAISFYFLLPLIPVIAVKQLGVDNSQAGYLIGVYSLSSLLIRPFAGYAVDSFGRKRIFLFSICFFALFTFSYYLAATFISFLLLRLLHGLTWGVFNTSSATIIADIVPPSRRGEGIGYFGLAMSLSMAVGPMFALWLAGDRHYDRLFIAATIPAVFAFFAASTVKPPPLQFRRKGFKWKNFIEIRVIPICIVQFFIAFVFGGLISFVALYCEEINVADGGVFFLFYAIAMSFTRPFGGRVMDRSGPKIVVTLGILLLIGGYMLLWVTHGITILVMAALSLGLGYGLFLPAIQTMIIYMVEINSRGVANSTFSATIDLGIGIGSIAMGWFANATSIGTMFFGSSLLHLVPLSFLLIYVLKDFNNNMIRDESPVLNTKT
ncbi:MAG: MFS transporter [Deltaproteobacteria bacterium]|nr:MFS transporter [Deltaproteobacteria bacterium]